MPLILEEGEEELVLDPTHKEIGLLLEDVYLCAISRLKVILFDHSARASETDSQTTDIAVPQAFASRRWPLIKNYSNSLKTCQTLADNNGQQQIQITQYNTQLRAD